MNPTILTVTDASLEADVLIAPGLVLVDFWAPWCAPCKTLAPLLDEIAVDHVGVLRVAKIDADDNAASMRRFAVRGLPTLLLFKDGAEVGRVVGLTTKTRLAALIDDQLAD